FFVTNLGPLFSASGFLSLSQVNFALAFLDSLIYVSGLLSLSRVL
ncbi:14161_t:CDS:1, partial [Racocetra persica]